MTTISGVTTRVSAVIMGGLLLVAACSSSRDELAWAPVKGYWEGTFMPESGMNLTLVLHFPPDEGGRQSARVLLWQDRMQIQDDPLTNVRMRGDSLWFYIRAKSTPFAGRFHADSCTSRAASSFLMAPHTRCGPVR